MGPLRNIVVGAMSKDQEMIRIKSAEGHIFIVDRKSAMVSGTIKSMLTGPGSFTENEQSEIHFPLISTRILEKVIQYFYFKLRYTNHTPNPKIPEFNIEPEIALELLMAANYLDT
eukprot:JP438941.1.p1 GENE.JP438941.1~~JP438941.1.p1  ORF type:complete len:115 (-),score=17.68 JP438941.1:85-429(-)